MPLAGSEAVTTAELILRAVTQTHKELCQLPRHPQPPLCPSLATLLEKLLVWYSSLILGRALPQCWLFFWASETFSLAGLGGHYRISGMLHVSNAHQFPKFISHHMG